MSAQAVLEQIADDLSSFECDPLGFVMWAFPWGEEGTPLEKENGPDDWQREELADIGERLRADPFRKIQLSTASGHGIGKSCETSWLILWALMTFPEARGVVTANSQDQLKHKTWSELAKWHGMLVPPIREQFVLTATAIYHRRHSQTWRIDATPNNENNPAAFAGLHNAGKRILIVFDEASEIPKVIWETASGATTDKDTQIIWAAYGNPTINTGQFKENTEGKFRALWKSRHVDARKVSRTNKDDLAEKVAAYGEDSDYVRVRIRGMFPRLGQMQLISSADVAAARTRPVAYNAAASLVAGLDVARFGDDHSVLQPRRGRDARTNPALQWLGMDTMQIAGESMLWIEENRPDGFFVDVGGVGAGVYDRLRQLKAHRITQIFPVDFGSAGGSTYMNGVAIRAANMRARMYLEMREWMPLGCIADSDDLEIELISPQYGHGGRDGPEIILERKRDMKKRLGFSPDKADALALTFAYPVAPKGLSPVLASARARTLPSGSDYDLYADLRD